MRSYGHANFRRAALNVNHGFASALEAALLPTAAGVLQIISKRSSSLSFTPTYAPGYGFPYLDSWLLYPRFGMDGASHRVTQAALPIGSTLTATIETAGFSTYSAIIGLYAYLPDTIDRSLNPVPHLQLSLPHIDLKLQAGEADPFKATIDGATDIVITPQLGWCWVFYRSNGTQQYVDVLYEEPDPFMASGSAVLGSAPAAVGSSFTVTKTYQKLTGYSDTYDPPHANHYVGPILIFNRVLSLQTLLDLRRAWLPTASTAPLLREANHTHDIFLMHAALHTELQLAVPVETQAIGTSPATTSGMLEVPSEAALLYSADNHGLIELLVDAPVDAAASQTLTSTLAAYETPRTAVVAADPVQTRLSGSVEISPDSGQGALAPLFLVGTLPLTIDTQGVAGNPVNVWADAPVTAIPELESTAYAGVLADVPLRIDVTGPVQQLNPLWGNVPVPLLPQPFPRVVASAYFTMPVLGFAAGMESFVQRGSLAAPAFPLSAALAGSAASADGTLTILTDGDMIAQTTIAGFLSAEVPSTVSIVGVSMTDFRGLPALGRKRDPTILNVYPWH